MIMSNIGAGEVRTAYLVKKNIATDVDSQIEDTKTETLLYLDGIYKFKYRYLTQREMIYQPISNHLKTKQDRVLFTSDTTLNFENKDKIYFSDGSSFIVTRVLPQSEHGMFLISKKPPHILELA